MKEIFDRVSVRKYTVQPVEAEKVEKLLRAAMAAPSAGNQQPWEFYIVRDRSAIQALSKSAALGVLRRAQSGNARSACRMQPLRQTLARRTAGHRDPKPRGGLAFPGILGTGPGRVHAESAAGSGASWSGSGLDGHSAASGPHGEGQRRTRLQGPQALCAGSCGLSGSCLQTAQTRPL